VPATIIWKQVFVETRDLDLIFSSKPSRLHYTTLHLRLPSVVRDWPFAQRRVEPSYFIHSFRMAKKIKLRHMADVQFCPDRSGLRIFGFGAHQGKAILETQRTQISSIQQNLERLPRTLVAVAGYGRRFRQPLATQRPTPSSTTLSFTLRTPFGLRWGQQILLLKSIRTKVTFGTFERTER
jgi:hypothetical protein